MELLPVLIKTMKQQFPEARAFGAANNYWHDADKTLRRRQASETHAKGAPVNSEQDQQTLRQEQARLEARRERWNRLSEDQQRAIQDRVAKVSSQTVQRFIAQGKFRDPLVERACLDEMEKSSIVD